MRQSVTNRGGQAGLQGFRARRKGPIHSSRGYGKGYREILHQGTRLLVSLGENIRNGQYIEERGNLLNLELD